MALKLSDGQRLAVNTKNKNILVSAAAGSGKTFVLTQRVLSRIIDDGWDIDSFLIVTFTRDAASEMKERIRKGLESRLEDNVSKKTAEHIEKQLILINRANISTIDAFCSKVVKQNFHKTELDSGYKNPTQVEAAELKKQAADDVLEMELEKGDEEFREFYNKFASKTNDRNIVNMMESLYIFADSLPYPDKWFDKCLSDYECEDFYESIWGREYIKQIEKSLEAARKYTDEAVSYFKHCQGKDLPKVINNVIEVMAEFENAYKLGGIDEIGKLNVSFRIDLRSVKDEYALEHIDIIKRFLNFIKDELKKAVEYSSVPREKNQMLYDCIKPDVKALVKITRAYMKRYEELKLDKQMAEFNDISHYCLSILRNSDGSTTEIAKEYQEKFNEIIIDEYQDSNYLQEEILTAVSRVEKGQNNIFMVGDVKQAIYKFRQTTPELFIDKYKKYSDKNNSQELILLSENYRSRSAVLDACNIVFKQIMDERLGNVEYNDDAALNPKAVYPMPDENINISKSTEILIADNCNVLSGPVECDLKPKDAEAKIIAKRIYEMLYVAPLYIYDNDEKKYRPVKKSDIVILVNRRTNADVIFDQLNSIGIDCLFEIAEPLFTVTEVKTIISLLRIIDNPLQDIDAVNVLHSPMYGLSFNELTEIRINNREDNVYTAVKEYRDNEDSIAEIVAKFIEDLEYYRDFAINNSIADLISEIYDRSNYFNYVGMIEGGRTKQSNLRLFKEKADKFEADAPMDLHSFIAYIDTDLSDDVPSLNKIGAASAVSGNEDVVKIMTIHKSKGLEFPVVFVSQLQNRFSIAYKSNDFIFDRELGIGIKYIDGINRIKYKTAPYDIIMDKYGAEEKSESLRLLYVALTRAREKLIITGAADSRGSRIGRTAVLNDFAQYKNTLLPFALRDMASNPLFWIISALKRTDMCNGAAIEQKWIPIEKADSLDELKAEAAIDIIEKINIADRDCGNKYKEIINERFNYVYPYSDETHIPSKISITEIKRKINNDEDDQINYYSSGKITGVPEFMKSESRLTAAQIGTLYHTVMENIDFKNTKSKEDIDKLIEALCNKKIISRNESKLIKTEKIQKFISSSLFERIKVSDGIFCEVPFVMSVKASRLKEYRNSNAELVVHGIIDLYFTEGDSIVLVDYKTDRIYGDLSELVDRYKIQLQLYKEAIEKSTGKNVKECIIYSIDKGVSLNVVP